MKGIVTAISFLTIVPVRSGAEAQAEDYGRSMLYFPAVGAAIGASVWGANLFFGAIAPAAVAAVLSLAFWIGISGALHLDGLADVCDGFYGGKRREDILSIMRDSRTGSMGAAGIAILLLVKYSALLSIGARAAGPWIVGACALSRWGMTISATAAPYARESGTGKSFIDNVGKKELLFSTGIALGLSLALFKAAGLLLAALVGALSLALTRYFKKRIGGVTGDTLGALNETCEAAVMIFMAVALKGSAL